MEKSLEARLGILLKDKGWHIALAESCTGGLLGHRLTNIPGSSAYYLGSVTAYANKAKERLLGVDIQTLEHHGAVSAESVEEMAQGIRSALNAEIALSISGIAGPDGGTVEKPVGLVWIGLSTLDFDWVQEFHFNGKRAEIKEQAADAALEM